MTTTFEIIGILALMVTATLMSFIVFAFYKSILTTIK